MSSRHIRTARNAKNAEDFMDGVTGDLFSDRVYAFTPRGDVFELAKGAGPLDMAFQSIQILGLKQLVQNKWSNRTTGL